jgi:hypothetical protein
MSIVIDSLHWLYSLYPLRGLNQTLHLDALQTIVPRETHGYRRLGCVDGDHSLGRLWHPGRLLHLYSN